MTQVAEKEQRSPGTVQESNVSTPFGHTRAEEETTGAAQSAKMATSQCGRYGHQSMWSLWSPVNVVVMVTSQCGRYGYQSIWPVVVMTTSQYGLWSL